MPLVLKDFITRTAEKKSAIFRPIQWLGTLTGDSMLELAQSEKAHREKGTRSTIGKANSKMYILTCDPWPTKSKTHEPFLLMANILSEAFLCEGIKPRKEQQYVTKVIRFRNRDSQRYSKSFRLKFLL